MLGYYGVRMSLPLSGRVIEDKSGDINDVFMSGGVVHVAPPAAAIDE